MSPVGRWPVSAVLGVPTVARTKTSMPFDVRVSGVLTAALDRGRASEEARFCFASGLRPTLSESVPRLPLPSVTRQERLELREGHVLRDETPSATGMAFLSPVANDAPAPGYRLDVAPAAALLARRLNGNC